MDKISLPLNELIKKKSKQAQGEPRKKPRNQQKPVTKNVKNKGQKNNAPNNHKKSASAVSGKKSSGSVKIVYVNSPGGFNNKSESRKSFPRQKLSPKVSILDRIDFPSNDSRPIESTINSNRIQSTRSPPVSTNNRDSNYNRPVSNLNKLAETLEIYTNLTTCSSRLLKN